MAKIPDRVVQAWKERNGPSILTTVDPDGMPNTIWVNIVCLHGEDRIGIGDIVFSKTRRNLEQPNCPGNYLWLTQAGKSFQLKGRISYEKEGPLFDAVKAVTDPKFELVGAAVLHVDEAWEGAERLA